ncbi:MAG: biopolymer transporter ExbD [Phycisphaeraceae bacterium]|nr:biopolymer transporter ExbD [Phycisphaeraceae bacterium]
MYSIRRNDYSPRVEMVPLIDVIFLLLTFFIYSLIVMVNAKVVPVTLAPVKSGGSATAREVRAITMDAQGRLFLDRQAIDAAELALALHDMAQNPEQPTLYLAVEAEGQVDRAPLLLKLIELVRASGIQHFAIVGAPGSDPAPGSDSGNDAGLSPASTGTSQASPGGNPPAP